MEKKMNIYAKLMKVRVEFHKLGIKKSGFNNHLKFKYFELDDFLVQATELLERYSLCSVISFTDEQAILTLIDCDNPNDTIQFTSPMKYDKKSSSEIQGLGSSQTYLSRYLYIQLLNIVETDTINANIGGITEDDVERLYKLGYKKGYLRGTVDDQIKKKYNKAIRELSKEEYENIQLGYEKCKDSKDKK